MRWRRSRALIGFIVILAISQAAGQQAKTSRAPLLWSSPGDIRSKDLFAGPGGPAGLPQPPYKFKKQIATGNSPKFDITDATGEQWRVKLGPEAHAEPVAARLLWAVGYFTNENYFVEQMRVEGIIPLARGDEFQNGDLISKARLQHKLGGHDKPWSWRNNPLKHTREFNGLRVMMALLHNWDLKDENNARIVDKKSGREIYYVSDLGASFGATGKSYTDAMSKSNFSAYKNKKFITKVTATYVDFDFPTHPALYHIFNLPFFIHSLRNHWIGKHIPREDVRWIASLLAQLSRRQIEDAFRAGGYSPELVTAYADVVQERIAELSRL